MRALGTYGYGNYAMRRDADAACQALSGQDLGAGAVYCTVKEKQAPKTEARRPRPPAPPGQGTDAPAPAQHADKVWTRAPAAPQPRLDTGAASRFVKGVIGGQARARRQGPGGHDVKGYEGLPQGRDWPQKCLRVLRGVLPFPSRTTSVWSCSKMLMVVN